MDESKAESRAPHEGTFLTRIIPILLLLIVPLLFYRAMVFQGLEPPAPDTQSHRPVAEWAKSAVEELGETPQWFPYVFSGMPSYGSFLYIPRPAANLLGQTLQLFSSNRGIRYVLLFAIAGIAAYGFFRRQGHSRLAATTAGLLYSLTPYFTGLVGAGHSTKLEALALVPAVLWAVDHLLDRPGPLAGAFLAATAATLAWANHPQIAYYAVLLIGLYAILRILLMRDRPRPWGKWLLWGGVGLVIAGALVTEPYLAIREYAPHSIRGSGSSLEAGAASGVDWSYATAWSFYPKELVSFLFPSWYGLAGTTYWGPLPFTQSTHYFGIIALGLAILGLWKGTDRRRWIWAGISLFVLVVGFGSNLPILYRPMYELLPMFDRFRVPSMIYALLPLCAGVPICAGIDWLARNGSSRATREPKRAPGRSTTRSPWWYATAGAILLWVLVYLAARAAHGDLSSFLRPQEMTAAQQGLEALAAMRRSMLFSSIHFGFLLVTVACLLLALAMRPTSSPRLRTGLIGIVMALAIVDVWRVSERLYDPEPRPEAAEIIPLRGAVEHVAKLPGPKRILPTDEYFNNNAYALLGVESIGGYQPAKLRYYQDVIDAGMLFSSGVLQMLNTQYVLADRAIEAFPSAEYTPKYPGDGYVYRLPQTPGHAWAVRELDQVKDPFVLLRRIGARDYDPEAIAYVYEEGLPTEFAPAEVTLLERGLHRIRLQVRAEGDAFVILSEIYYEPGWRATVDGNETKIHRVNHVLRGVQVPAGDHEVVFQFHSTAHATGQAVSRAAAAAWLLLFAIPLVGRLRRKNEPQPH